jgi:hypothetical protein
VNFTTDIRKPALRALETPWRGQDPRVRRWLPEGSARVAVGSASAFSAWSRSAQARRSASADCTSVIRALRFSANIGVHFFQLGAITRHLRRYAVRASRSACGACWRFDPAALVRGELRQPAIGKFGFAAIACCSA